jgi:hypothetical protein
VARGDDHVVGVAGEVALEVAGVEGVDLAATISEADTP